MRPAEYEQIVALLENTPNAHPAWADVLHSAALSVPAIEALIVTMANTADSPMRRAEDSILSKEIVRLNGVFGTRERGDVVKGKTVVSVRAMLTQAEQMCVVKLTEGFAAVLFKSSDRFNHNGHAVMNAVRRATSMYCYSKVPKGESMIEVGPSVRNWVTGGYGTDTELEFPGKYVGARPIIGARDAVRTEWRSLVDRIRSAPCDEWEEAVRNRAGRLVKSFDSVFPNKKIQDLEYRASNIVSNDSNYDIKFDDMLRVMIQSGARAWYGSMVRAKGLTKETRKSEGTLQLMGVKYRVDWKDGRIDFRHPRCSAFGYSHNVWEYMKYEERNGYVWECKNANYVYSKGPETNDELLFFTVLRVAKFDVYAQPRYMENPWAGWMELTSVWPVGDWKDGLPRTFERVVYHVDKLAFGKVLEKRRALDYMGDLAQTITLVRSTNVRMWLNGTPVGVNRKIEASLAEATAVAVEVLVSKMRLGTNDVFAEAMRVHKEAVADRGVLRRMLEQWVDMKVVTGSVFGPMISAWTTLRAVLLDAALSTLSEFNVSVAEVDHHVNIGFEQGRVVDKTSWTYVADQCSCGEAMDLAGHAKAHGGVVDGRLYDMHLEVRDSSCVFCDKIRDGILSKPMEDEKESGSDDTTAVDSNESGDDSGFSEGSSSEDASDVTSVSSVDVGPVVKKVSEVSVMANDVPLMSEGSIAKEVIRGGGVNTSGEVVGPVVTEVKEIAGSVGWSEELHGDYVEYRSIRESIELKAYVMQCTIVETRVDATRIARAGCETDKDVDEMSTNRTQHSLVEFRSGRHVKTLGRKIADFGAIFSATAGRMYRTSSKGSCVMASVPDGWYYTSNHLKVWNADDLIEALEYALNYGRTGDLRKERNMILGVPGAGKTYMMMETVARRYKDDGRPFLVISVTQESVRAAIKYGVEFGLPKRLLMARCRTLDSYLINGKFPTHHFYFDEFAMAHAGDGDAAVSVSGARSATMYGDAEQIPYNPFCATFDVRYAKYGDSIPAERRVFLPMTHRLSEDVCAAFLDRYPRIFPCDCHRVGEKHRPTLSFVPIGTAEDVPKSQDVRYHTYRQEEREDLRLALKYSEDPEVLRAKAVGGMATVHQDQGCTKRDVCTVRLAADWDRNASPENPSLFNKVNYVLTDMTRHTHSYVYMSTSNEVDEIQKRILLSSDPERLAAVKAKRGIREMSVMEFDC